MYRQGQGYTNFLQYNRTGYGVVFDSQVGFNQGAYKYPDGSVVTLQLRISPCVVALQLRISPCVVTLQLRISPCVVTLQLRISPNDRVITEFKAVKCFWSSVSLKSEWHQFKIGVASV